MEKPITEAALTVQMEHRIKQANYWRINLL